MATYDAIKTVGFLTNEKISNLKYTYIGSRCHTVREREREHEKIWSKPFSITYVLGDSYVSRSSVWTLDFYCV